jgi:hypothetical protein
MTRMLRAALPLTAIAIACVSVLTRDPGVRYSATWSIDAAVSSVLVLWPLLAGAAAADSVRLRRSRSDELVLALPPGAAARLLLRRSAVTGLWTLAGFVVAAAVAAGIAGAHGSWLAPADLVSLVPVVAGTLAFALLGGVIGWVAPSWVTPPLLAALVFGASAYDLLGARRLTAFTGSTSSSIVAMDLDPVAVAGVTLVLALVALTAAATWAALLTSARPVIGVAGVIGIVTVVGWVVIGGERYLAPFQYEAPASWACSQVGDRGSEVCLPPDQERDRGDMIQALAPIDARLAELEPTGPVTFSPAPADDGQVQVPLPVGDATIDRASLAQSVSASLGPCFPALLERAQSEDDSRVILAAHISLALWADPSYAEDPGLLTSLGLTDASPTLTDARNALKVLRQCPAG